MPEIKPFKAWRYHTPKVKNLSLVVAPPYDVISKEEQARLYDSSPYNVIRMELGKDMPGDTPSENRYTRAKGFLDGLKSEGALAQDPTASIYVYLQDYEEEGKKKARIGFFATMKLDEKAVLKHENTLTGPKEDRLHLLKAVRTNLSPIFGLFEDNGSVQTLLKPATRKSPVLDVQVAGVRHRLYLEQRPEVLKKVAAKMKSKPMFIADGHHRFEVACQFKKWMESGGDASTTKPGGLVPNAERSGEDWNYAMVYFSDCRHNPFKIFPTHRLIRFKQDLPSTLAKIGSVKTGRNLGDVLETLEDCREDAKDKSYQFAFYSSKHGFQLVTLDKKAAAKVAKDPVSKLDVAVLHEKILAPHFGITAVEKSEAIDFTRDAKEAQRKVQSGEFDAAVFLRPTSLSEMLLVSKKGLKMPQKSTYFYPKLLTGLVFYGFNGSLS